MSYADDPECQDQAEATARCDVCIEQLVVIGQELLGAITLPADAALDAFATAATKLQRRLKYGARHLLAGIEATALALGPMPAIPSVAASQFGAPDSAGVGETPATATDASLPTSPTPTTTPIGDTVCPPPDTLSTPHDVQEANLLILADREQSWHQRFRAWYNGAADSVLLSGSLKDAIAEREAAAAVARESSYALRSVRASNITDS